ncbi:LigA [Microbacterium sp. HM58-2]|nr:LigA [Microbacterium sp. HM58-2]
MTDLDLETEAPVEDPFIAPVAMEEDIEEHFPGDRGTLDPEIRRVLVHILQRRFIAAERNRREWTLLLEHQHVIESRLNDLYLRLVVDHGRGFAYKQQLRSDEIDMPVLLKDAPYSRAETLVLVHLRTVYQRESAAGEASVRIDIEDVEQTVLSYFTEVDGSTAKQQRAIRGAMDRLDREGIVHEESSGRYRISALVEVVLSAETLKELRDWLRSQERAQEVVER